MTPTLDQRTIQALLKFAVDRQSAENAKKEVKGIREEFEKNQLALDKMTQVGDIVTRIGVGMTAVGSGIIALMVGGSQKYIQTMGQVEEQSATWLHNSERISNAQIRLGRTLTDVINPGMNFAATAAEKIAKVAEDNPWILKAAGISGGLLAGVGTLTGLAGFGMQATAHLSEMQSAGGVSGMLAGATLRIGQATLLSGAVILGAEVGASLGNAIAGKIYGPGYQKQNLGDAALTVMKGFQIPTQYAASGLMNAGVLSKDDARTFANAINSLNSWVGNLVGARSTSSGTPSDDPLIKAGVVDSFRQFSIQMAESERQYETQRSNILQQYGEQRVAMEQQYTTQVSRTIRNFGIQQFQAMQDFSISQTRQARNFNQSESLAEVGYYEQRTSLASSFHQNVQRSEEDHQVRMRKLLEDHNDRVEELGQSRDALGLVREMRRYERVRRDEEDTFRTDAGRKNQDYARQVRELEINFRQQRSLRMQQFEQQKADQEADFNRNRTRQKQAQALQIADMAADHKVQMDILAQHEKNTLDQLKYGYDQQIRLMRDALIERIRALDPIILGDYQAYTRYLQGISQQFQAWLAANKGNFVSSTTSTIPARGSVGGRASGGYATYGVYVLGDTSNSSPGKREHVLDGYSTEAIEGIMGDRNLTPSKIVGAVARGMGSRNRNVSIPMHIEFHGSFSDEERSNLRSQMDEVARTVIEEVTAD